MELLFHRISDVEEKFYCIDGTFEVGHQKRKFGEFGKQICEIKSDYFTLEAFFSNELTSHFEVR